MSVTITVKGSVPAPGGSKTMGFRKDGSAFFRPASKKTTPWRKDVAKAAAQQYSGPLLAGPVWMEYTFLFPRPKHHYGTGKNAATLKAKAPYWHTIKPDLTKIIRSTEDALTGIVLQDDCLVCSRNEEKRYCAEGEQPGVIITIAPLEV